MNIALLKHFRARTQRWPNGSDAGLIFQYAFFTGVRIRRWTFFFFFNYYNFFVIKSVLVPFNRLKYLSFLYSVFLRKTEYIAIVQDRGG